MAHCIGNASRGRWCDFAPVGTRESAVAIRDGAVLAVGTDGEVTGGYSGTTPDLAGQVVLPRFNDTRAHPIQRAGSMLVFGGRIVYEKES